MNRELADNHMNKFAITRHVRRGCSLPPLWGKAPRRGGRGVWLSLRQRYFVLNRSAPSPQPSPTKGEGVDRSASREALFITSMVFMRMPCFALLLLLALSACSEQADAPDVSIQEPWREFIATNQGVSLPSPEASVLKRLLPRLIENRLQTYALDKIMDDICLENPEYGNKKTEIREIIRVAVRSESYRQGLQEILSKNFSSRDAEDLLALMEVDAIFDLGHINGKAVEQFAQAAKSGAVWLPVLISAKATHPDFDLSPPVNLPDDSILDRLTNRMIARQIRRTSPKAKSMLPFLMSSIYRQYFQDDLEKLSQNEMERILAILVVDANRPDRIDGFLTSLERAYLQEKALLNNLIKTAFENPTRAIETRNYGESVQINDPGEATLVHSSFYFQHFQEVSREGRELTPRLPRNLAHHFNGIHAIALSGVAR